MAKRVTITDVARETGVSIKTVSNVLNNTGSMRPETRSVSRMPSNASDTALTCPPAP